MTNAICILFYRIYIIDTLIEVRRDEDGDNDWK